MNPWKPLLHAWVQLAHAFDTTWRAVLFVLDAEERCWCRMARTEEMEQWERDFEEGLR